MTESINQNAICVNRLGRKSLSFDFVETKGSLTRAKGWQPRPRTVYAKYLKENGFNNDNLHPATLAEFGYSMINRLTTQSFYRWVECHHPKQLKGLGLCEVY